MNRWILAVADDLTGALEVGAKFAGCGVNARVAYHCRVPEPTSPVLVVDSETRHTTASDAGEVVRRIGQRMRRHEPWIVYKKTDSTLRGNIEAELRALHETFPEREILYVPAYPTMGRTVRNGQLLVHGVPVDQTEFARDSLNPVRHSLVQSAIGDLPAKIDEGELEEDVLVSARYVAGSRRPLLVAGPAAIAGAMAACLPLQRRVPASLPRLHRCLIVNGSMSSVSSEQIAYASGHGCLGNGWEIFTYTGAGSGVDRALQLGQWIRDALAQSPADAIMVFGGDTAFGIHQALGCPLFDCVGEVVPGVPLTRAGSLYWITKAGGFGTPDVLCRIRERLT